MTQLFCAVSVMGNPSRMNPAHFSLQKVANVSNEMIVWNDIPVLFYTFGYVVRSRIVKDVVTQYDSGEKKVSRELMILPVGQEYQHMLAFFGMVIGEEIGSTLFRVQLLSRLLK